METVILFRGVLIFGNFRSIYVCKFLFFFSKLIFRNVQYNFEGRYDLVKFVKLVAEAGLYVHLRIGPYVCAEWNYGYIDFFFPLKLMILFSVILMEHVCKSSYFYVGNFWQRIPSLVAFYTWNSVSD